MYAGAVAVPLMIGDRLGLSKEAIAMSGHLRSLCCGIVTLLQCMGLGRPYGDPPTGDYVVTLAAVTPMIAIGMNPESACWGYLVPLSPRVLSPHY
ncbi:solute carrier family 23 protein [Shigella flexneri]